MILFDKVAILGAGLLGSSIAWAMKDRKLCSSIFVWSRTLQTREKCKEKSWCDCVFENIEDAVKDVDLVIIASTPASITNLAKKIAPHLKKDVILTDLGSVKQSIAKNFEEIFKGMEVSFVPSHPMAGSEKSGIDFADKDLFEDACCFVCGKEDNWATKKIIELWKALNMKVKVLSAKEHDEIASCISHIPQAVASSLALFAKSKNPEIFKNFAGNGFRDTTRIAKSDEKMWTDIFLLNSENVAKNLRDFIKITEEFATFVESKDEQKILDFMKSAKDTRLKMEK